MEKNYTKVTYEGQNGSKIATGTIVELKSGQQWIEDEQIMFKEISESRKKVVLYDEYRDLTLTLNLAKETMKVQWDDNTLIWDLTSIKHSNTAFPATSSSNEPSPAASSMVDTWDI
ncbi:MAG TPA: hypothetical protein VHL98_18685 [Microvirga sp.]|jgi:hypothetical protein|nr:hypothetical protein [Microvirga sp.]